MARDVLEEVAEVGDQQERAGAYEVQRDAFEREPAVDLVFEKILPVLGIGLVSVAEHPMAEQLVVVGYQEAADRLVDEPVEKIGFQSITLAKALLGDVTNDAEGSRVYAVPLLGHRDDDPLTFLAIG